MDEGKRQGKYLIVPDTLEWNGEFTEIGDATAERNVSS